MPSRVQIINMYVDWQYQPRFDMNWWGGGGDQGELMGEQTAYLVFTAIKSGKVVISGRKLAAGLLR